MMAIDDIFRDVFDNPTTNGDERPPMRQRLLTLDQLANMPPLEPLIHGVVDLDNFVLIYGPKGSGKSFVAIDMLASVATGHRFHGRIVEQSPVIYVVGEGAAGLTQRYDAWMSERGLMRPTNLFILPEPVNLLSPAMVGEFASIAADIGAKFIVFDTLARCMVGGDENSARDAGMAVEQLDSIRRKTGATVAAVHHAGKAIEAGARGSSAFEAAADTVLSITKDERLVVVKATKQKNHAEPNPISLLMRSLDGEHVVLDDYRASDDLPQAALATLAALSEIEVAGGVPLGVWRSESSAAESSFFRHRKGLVTLGLVSNVGTDKQPRYQVSEAGTLALSKDSHAGF